MWGEIALVQVHFLVREEEGVVGVCFVDFLEDVWRRWEWEGGGVSGSVGVGVGDEEGVIFFLVGRRPGNVNLESWMVRMVTTESL